MRVNSTETIKEAEVGLFQRVGQQIKLEGAAGASALLLSGQPLNEPIVGQGPFVMNSHQEIRQAIADYKLGQLY